MGRRALRRNLISLSIALVAGVLFGYAQFGQSQALYQGGPLYAIETSLHDLILRGRKPEGYGSTIGRDPRTFITIVAMDDKSLSELGIFRSWPRTYQAQVLENLLAGRPRAVAFDVGFFEQSAEDQALIDALTKARTMAPAVSVVLASGGGNQAPASNGELQFTDVLQPTPLIAAVADVASANVVPDDFGSVRSMPLMVGMDGQERPSLGLAAFAKYLRLRAFEVDRPTPESLTILRRAGDQVQAVREDVPVDRNGMVKINYFGPPSTQAAPTFNIVSFVDVMKGRADPAIWRDGIVFVGLINATGFADDYWTPVSGSGQKMAGVEIHANVAATMFSTQFIREVPLATQVGVVVLLAMLTALIAANFSVAASVISSVLVLGLYTFVNMALLDQGRQVPLSNPLAAGLLTFMGVTVYRVAVEQRQSRALRGALASVIPASVALEIARDPDQVRMGGERREITVLFTDLKNFTTFSESVEPEVLARVITEYLSAMTQVVFKHGGTVDKFIGDAIMAFWNAPLDDPEHARHACEAALDMQAELERLSNKWVSEKLPRQLMRIGINTGPASVGNMGTSQRFAYTALGDTVNLGARLEPLNNEYGTWICISQATLHAAGGQDRYLARFLDLVAVKGKTEPVAVYELIGRTSDAALSARYHPVLDPFHQGMVLYQARKFDEAGALFRTAMAATGNGADEPSAVYIARCEDLASEPPASDWDGVYVMKHK